MERNNRLNSLKENYFINLEKQGDACCKADIGMIIAMNKFEEFQDLFIQAQYSFQVGIGKNHPVYSSDKNNRLAQKDYQFYFFKHAIQDYNACYDYILQIIYFGFDFFSFYKKIECPKDYEDNLRHCEWNFIKKYMNNEFKTSYEEMYDGRNKKYDLTDWTNRLKHRGSIIVEGLDTHRTKIKLWNKETGNIIFSSDNIKPLCISFSKIEKCLIYHNNRLANFADSLYRDLGLSDSSFVSKKKFNINCSSIDTTNCIFEVGI